MRTGIFIDDSGNPGIKSQSVYDTSDRKSWLALILNPAQRLQAEQQMSNLLKDLKERHNVSEFHFTEIYNGKGGFKGVELNRRLEIFENFGSIYGKNQYPMLIQTSTGEELGRNNIISENANIKCDQFNLNIVSDQALFFLLVRIKGFLKLEMVPEPVEIIIDEHASRRSSTNHKIELLADSLYKRELIYKSSKDEPLLQLVDFAAFMLNRCRWILCNVEKKPLDKSFLEIAQNASFNVLNMERKLIKLDGDSVNVYDQTLRDTYLKHQHLGTISLSNLLKDIYK